MSDKTASIIERVRKSLRVNQITVSCIVDRKKGGSSFNGFGFSRGGAKESWEGGESKVEKEIEGEGYSVTEALLARAIMAKEAARSSYLDALYRGQLSRESYKREWPRIEEGHDKLISAYAKKLEEEQAADE